MHTCRCHATFSTGRPTTGRLTANTGQAICLDILFMATTLLVNAEHIQICLQSGRNSFCTKIDFLKSEAFQAFSDFPCMKIITQYLKHICSRTIPVAAMYSTGSAYIQLFVTVPASVPHWNFCMVLHCPASYMSQ